MKRKMGCLYVAEVYSEEDLGKIRSQNVRTKMLARCRKFLTEPLCLYPKKSLVTYTKISS